MSKPRRDGGYSQIPSGATRAFLWENGVMVNIGTLGTAATFAFGINQNTEIAGFGRVGGAGTPFHAFKWHNGVFTVMTDLGTLGGPISAASGINENGQIVGMAMTADFEIHAFSYDQGVMTDLGVLPGGHFSGAVGTNGPEQMVYVAFAPSRRGRAILLVPRSPRRKR